jgi:hypothetical protein
MSKTAQKQSRAELTALAAAQAQEIAGLREQLAQAQAQLRERQIVCERAGTMAEAAMALNGAFKAADEAAAQYLENIRAFTEQQHKVCAQIEQTTREQAEAMLRETEARCRAREKEADAYWANLSAKFERFCSEHQELRDLLEEGRNLSGAGT